MSEMNEEVLDEAMESSTEENVSETKEDENVTICSLQALNSLQKKKQPLQSFQALSRSPIR